MIALFPLPTTPPLPLHHFLQCYYLINPIQTTLIIQVIPWYGKFCAAISTSVTQKAKRTQNVCLLSHTASFLPPIYAGTEWTNRLLELAVYRATGAVRARNIPTVSKYTLLSCITQYIHCINHCCTLYCIKSYWLCTTKYYAWTQSTNHAPLPCSPWKILGYWP